jgi:hypothetical protein
MSNEEDFRRRIEALKAHKELEDSFIVLTHVETRMSQIVRLQAEALANHAPRLERAEILLAEMTEKVNFLIDREMRREGGPESRA